LFISSFLLLPDFLVNKDIQCGNCDALQLEGCPTSRQPFSAVVAKFVLRVRSNCCFRAFGQNFDNIIRFSDPNFLKVSNSLAITRFFQVFPVIFLFRVCLI